MNYIDKTDNDQFPPLPLIPGETPCKRPFPDTGAPLSGIQLQAVGQGWGSWALAQEWPWGQPRPTRSECPDEGRKLSDSETCPGPGTVRCITRTKCRLVCESGLLRDTVSRVQSCFFKIIILALAGVAQWIECGLWTKASPVLFPVRARAWVVGQVPSGGHVRGNHTLMFLSLSFSLPSLLSKNK